MWYKYISLNVNVHYYYKIPFYYNAEAEKIPKI